jgi:predicted DNA-binding ArsR family transcriptional regulator
MSPEPLAAERRRVMEALADGSLTSSAVARRLGAAPAKRGQPLLFPALHSLEADGRLTADWQTGSDGLPRRTYRKRHLLPVRFR